MISRNIRTLAEAASRSTLQKMRVGPSIKQAPRKMIASTAEGGAELPKSADVPQTETSKTMEEIQKMWGEYKKTNDGWSWGKFIAGAAGIAGIVGTVSWGHSNVMSRITALETGKADALTITATVSALETSIAADIATLTTSVAATETAAEKASASAKEAAEKASASAKEAAEKASASAKEAAEKASAYTEKLAISGAENAALKILKD
jgi:hypothetical protein